MTTLNTAINSIQKSNKALVGAKRVVKREVNSVCSSLLTVNQVGGVDRLPELANLIINALTVREQQTFSRWVKTHFPVQGEKDSNMIAEYSKDYATANIKKDRAAARKTFKDEYGSDYWKWAETTGKNDSQPVEWDKRVMSAIKSLLDEEKGKMTVAEMYELIESAYPRPEVEEVTEDKVPALKAA